MNPHNFISFDLAPDGRFIVFSSGRGALFLYNVATRKVERITIDRDIARFPRFSSGGDVVVFSTFEKGPPDRGSEPGGRGSELRYFSMSDRKVHPLFAPSGFKECQAFFFANSDKIGFTRAHLYRDYRGQNYHGKVWDEIDFYVTDIHGSKPLRVTHDKRPGDGVLVAGGLQKIDRILFIDRWDQHGNLYVANAHKGTTKVWRNILKNPTDVLGVLDLCTSGNDTKMVMRAEYDRVFQFDLYLLDEKTKQISLLLQANQEECYLPVFSPDGKWVYYLRDSQASKEITLQRMDMTRKVRETVLSADILNPQV